MSTKSPNEVRQTERVAGNGIAQHSNWSNICVERTGEGIERKMFVGNRMMICGFRFAPFLVTPSA